MKQGRRATVILVVPDIHGHRAELDRVLAIADRQFGRDTKIVFLGDLVDRGPDSRGVVQTLIDGLDAGRDWVVLRGNHDQLLIDGFNGLYEDFKALRVRPGWLADVMGGVETLRSYGIDAFANDFDLQQFGADIPAAHKDFLSNLPYTYETNDLIFVHAGIRPGIPLADQSPDDLIWIREPFLSDRQDHGKLVVHGHTSVKRPEHHGNHVNLDAGTGWGRPLCIACFEGRDAWLLTEERRVPLTPST